MITRQQTASNRSVAADPEDPPEETSRPEISAHHLLLRSELMRQSRSSSIMARDTRTNVMAAFSPLLPAVSLDGSECTETQIVHESNVSNEFLSVNVEQRQKLHDILQAALDLVD